MSADVYFQESAMSSSKRIKLEKDLTKIKENNEISQKDKRRVIKLEPKMVTYSNINSSASSQNHMSKFINVPDKYNTSIINKQQQCPYYLTQVSSHDKNDTKCFKSSPSRNINTDDDSSINFSNNNNSNAGSQLRPSEALFVRCLLPSCKRLAPLWFKGVSSMREKNREEHRRISASATCQNQHDWDAISKTIKSMSSSTETDTLVNLLKKLYKELPAESVLWFIKCWLDFPEATENESKCALSRGDVKNRMRRIDGGKGSDKVWRLDTIVGMMYHGMPMSSTDTNIMAHTCDQELCIRPQHLRFKASSVALVVVLKALQQTGYSILPPPSSSSSSSSSSLPVNTQSATNNDESQNCNLVDEYVDVSGPFGIEQLQQYRSEHIRPCEKSMGKLNTSTNDLNLLESYPILKEFYPTYSPDLEFILAKIHSHKTNSYTSFLSSFSNPDFPNTNSTLTLSNNVTNVPSNSHNNATSNSTGSPQPILTDSIILGPPPQCQSPPQINAQRQHIDIAPTPRKIITKTNATTTNSAKLIVPSSNNKSSLLSCSPKSLGHSFQLTNNNSSSPLNLFSNSVAPPDLLMEDGLSMDDGNRNCGRLSATELSRKPWQPSESLYSKPLQSTSGILEHSTVCSSHNNSIHSGSGRSSIVQPALSGKTTPRQPPKKQLEARTPTFMMGDDDLDSYDANEACLKIINNAESRQLHASNHNNKTTIISTTTTTTATIATNTKKDDPDSADDSDDDCSHGNTSTPTTINMTSSLPIGCDDGLSNCVPYSSLSPNNSNSSNLKNYGRSAFKVVRNSRFSQNYDCEEKSEPEMNDIFDQDIADDDDDDDDDENIVQDINNVDNTVTSSNLHSTIANLGHSANFKSKNNNSNNNNVTISDNDLKLSNSDRNADVSNDDKLDSPLPHTPDPTQIQRGTSIYKLVNGKSNFGTTPSPLDYLLMAINSTSPEFNANSSQSNNHDNNNNNKDFHSNNDTPNSLLEPPKLKRIDTSPASSRLLATPPTLNFDNKLSSASASKLFSSSKKPNSSKKASKTNSYRNCRFTPEQASVLLSAMRTSPLATNNQEIIDILYNMTQQYGFIHPLDSNSSCIDQIPRPDSGILRKHIYRQLRGSQEPQVNLTSTHPNFRCTELISTAGNDETVTGEIMAQSDNHPSDNNNNLDSDRSIINR